MTKKSSTKKSKSKKDVSKGEFRVKIMHTLESEVIRVAELVGLLGESVGSSTPPGCDVVSIYKRVEYKKFRIFTITDTKLVGRVFVAKDKDIEFYADERETIEDAKKLAEKLVEEMHKNVSLIRSYVPR